MSKQGLSIIELRERLAQEAARLVNEHGIQDYGLAKRKAARRFGIREAGALPSNAEIEDCVREWHRIFEPDEHQKYLDELRRLAIEVMRLFPDFETRLAGPVLTGAITANSFIELHLFSDAPEDVAMKLDECGITYRNCQRRYRYDRRCTLLTPGFRFTYRGERIDALVFPEKGLRQAPMSPIDQRPIRRAHAGKILKLLNSQAEHELAQKTND